MLEHLNNQEYLSRLADARLHSPVIEELAARLEKVIESSPEKLNGGLTHCPICEAQLKVDIDINGVTLEKP